MGRHPFQNRIPGSNLHPARINSLLTSRSSPQNQIVIGPGIANGQNTKPSGFYHAPGLFDGKPLLQWRAKFHRLIHPVEISEMAGRLEHNPGIADNLPGIAKVMESDAEEDKIGTPFAGNCNLSFARPGNDIFQPLPFCLLAKTGDRICINISSIHPSPVPDFPGGRKNEVTITTSHVHKDYAGSKPDHAKNLFRILPRPPYRIICSELPSAHENT